MNSSTVIPRILSHSLSLNMILNRCLLLYLIVPWTLVITDLWKWILSIFPDAMFSKFNFIKFWVKKIELYRKPESFKKLFDLLISFYIMSFLLTFVSTNLKSIFSTVFFWHVVYIEKLVLQINEISTQSL